jgi:hypothetical protein
MGWYKMNDKQANIFEIIQLAERLEQAINDNLRPAAHCSPAYGVFFMRMTDARSNLKAALLKSDEVLKDME